MLHDLFPLPLNTIERYVLCEDSKECLWTFVIAAQLRGRLNRDALEQAIEEALERHPLLDSVVESRALRTPVFVPGKDRRCPVKWVQTDDRATVGSLTRHQFDLSRETGLRVIVISDNDRATVHFEFHHCTTDGIGAIEFICDVLARYANLTSDANLDLPPLDPMLLRQRSVRASLVESAGSWSAFASGLTRETAKILGRWTSPLARNRESRCEDREPIGYPGSRSRRIPDVLKALRRAAAAHNATVNDLVMASMMRMLHWWNDRQGQDADRQWFRLYIPVNLREPRHDHIPAVNLASCVMLTHRGKSFHDVAGLTRNLSSHIGTLVRLRHEIAWQRVAAVFTIIPGMKAAMGIAPKSTAIVTNVGDLRRRFPVRFPSEDGRCVVGDVILEDLISSAPLRRGNHATLSLSTYAGGLTLNLTLQPNGFSGQDCEEMLSWLENDLVAIATPFLPDGWQGNAPPGTPEFQAQHES
ncbi:MAG: condensation domain-containing protein [Planctomycetaceae bacterium]